MTSLTDMLQYDCWSNTRVMDYLLSNGGGSERSRKLLEHILFAQNVWMSRIKGRPFLAPTAPLSLDDLRVEFQKSYDEYLEFLSWLQDDELDSTVQYQDLKGNQGSNSLRIILTQVLNHGTYHRGQIALITRDEGGVPLATDYIVYQRELQAQSKV